MIKYEVIIYWSDEDNAFIAEVPELPGCMADGPTKAKALAAADRVSRGIPSKRCSAPTWADPRSLTSICAMSSVGNIASVGCGSSGIGV